MTQRGQFDEVGEDLDLDNVITNEEEAGESGNDQDVNDEYDGSDGEGKNTRDWCGKRNSNDSLDTSPQPDGQQNGNADDLSGDNLIMLHVGNLHFKKVTTKTLRDLFSPYGNIKRIKLVRAKEGGRSRGFSFVVFENAEEGKKAMKELNRSLLAGRALKVDIAKASPKDLDDNDDDDYDEEVEEEEDSNSRKRPRDLRDKLEQRTKRPRMGGLLSTPVFGPPVDSRFGLMGHPRGNNMQGLLDTPGHFAPRGRMGRPGPGGPGLLSHHPVDRMGGVGLGGGIGGGGGGSNRMPFDDYPRRDYDDYEQRRMQNFRRMPPMDMMGGGDERDMYKGRGGRYQDRYDDPMQNQAPPIGTEDERALSSIKARAALAGSILRSLLPGGEPSQKPQSSMMDGPVPSHMPRRSGPLLEDPVIRSRLPEPQYPRAFSPPRLVNTLAGDSRGVQMPFREQQRQQRGYSSGGYQSQRTGGGGMLADPLLDQMARARTRARDPYPYSMPSGGSSRW